MTNTIGRIKFVFMTLTLKPYLTIYLKIARIEIASKAIIAMKAKSEISVFTKILI